MRHCSSFTPFWHELHAHAMHITLCTCSMTSIYLTRTTDGTKIDVASLTQGKTILALLRHLGCPVSLCAHVWGVRCMPAALHPALEGGAYHALFKSLILHKTPVACPSLAVLALQQMIR